jgi:hypothetical protein
MLDLKTVFRARKVTRRIINMLGINADKFFLTTIFLKPQNSCESGMIFGEGIARVKKVLSCAAFLT